MITILPTNLEQSIYLTLRDDVNTSTLVFTKEGQTESIEVSATVTKQGYYQTATFTLETALSNGSNYTLLVKDSSNKELHKGTVLVTDQIITDYSINHNEYTSTDTSGNDFILF